MTHDDLATLLRDHVSYDEPPTPLPTRALTGGRRLVRTRRLGLVGGTVAALALAGAAVVPQLRGEDDATPVAMDPRSAAALEAYDAARMPTLMDEHVRAVLERSVPDLGPSTFTARDDQWNDLPERHWDKASGLSVSYGSETHEWTTAISHSRGEAEGDPDRYCRDGLDGGFYVECTAERTPDGSVVISKLSALKPFFRDSWKVVRVRNLDTVPLDRLWFDREVKVVKSQTLITYVNERVRATDRDPEAAAFATPYADLVRIGTDPELVMPVPPPGENGCPAWSLHAESMSCS